jgi:hypothetical protein
MSIEKLNALNRSFKVNNRAPREVHITEADLRGEQEFHMLKSRLRGGGLLVIPVRVPGMLPVYATDPNFTEMAQYGLHTARDGGTRVGNNKVQVVEAKGAFDEHFTDQPGLGDMAFGGLEVSLTNTKNDYDRTEGIWVRIA